ncbi:MAG: hypothetical protein H7222_04805 [Methylotenera sp.]|nr:hypothetical protein [Oligoflexia bacterium]
MTGNFNLFRLTILFFAALLWVSPSEAATRAYCHELVQTFSPLITDRAYLTQFKNQGANFLNAVHYLHSLKLHSLQNIPSEAKRIDFGNQNEGVYLYRDGSHQGRPLALKLVTSITDPDARLASRQLVSKLLKDPEHAVLTDDEIFEISITLRSFASGMEKARIAEQVGGPKLYGGGIIWLHELPYFYTELEWLGYEEKFSSLENCENCGVELKKAYAAHPDLAAKAARLLLSPLELRTNPGDSDILLMENGSLRWLDSGEWVQHSQVSIMARAYASSFWKYVDMLTHYRAGSLPGGVQSAEAISDSFIELLRESKRFTAEEKNLLLSKIAEAEPRFATRFSVRF